MLSINLVHNISDFRYVEHPEKNKVTNAWLSNGEYEIEALGVRYPAKLHLKSPFDSKNLRIQGEYDIDELRYINGQLLYIIRLIISTYFVENIQKPNCIFIIVGWILEDQHLMDTHQLHPETWQQQRFRQARFLEAN